MPDRLYDQRIERDACGAGFVAERNLSRCDRALPLALTALERLEHRGAVNADGRTGDGAGVLTAVPKELLRRSLPPKLRPSPIDFGVGMLFLPRNVSSYGASRRLVARVLSEEGLELLHFRKVPVQPDALGAVARRSRPEIAQAIVRRPERLDEDSFERVLHGARVRLEARSREAALTGLHVASFSARTVTYKALARSADLSRFYTDLRSPDYRTAFAVFHRRFSTNTSPSWSLTQPFRSLAHNGEINTIAGNRAWMLARAHEARASGSTSFPSGGISDSSTLDDALSSLMSAGRDPLEAMSLLVPPAWENDSELPERIRELFEWRSASLEPWDGPAFVVFTDGRTVGASLDRNGLRPARFSLAEDGLVFVASEAGVLEADSADRGRLGPGDILAVDLESGALLDRATIRAELARRHPYREWLAAHRLFPEPRESEAPSTHVTVLRAFGVTREELQLVLGPMTSRGATGVGSMGDDTPLAVLSPRPRLLSDYFRQRFAQVTNPPIDPLRESLVMSLGVHLGRRAHLEEIDEARHTRVDLASPVLSPEELQGLLSERRGGFRSEVLPMTFPRSSGAPGFAKALAELTGKAERAIEAGATLLVLDDRGLDCANVTLPALLAVASVHHQLVRAGKRMEASLVVATGEARDDHQVAALLAFGAEAVCPWLAFALLRDIEPHARGVTRGTEAEQRYRAALEKGLLKILSKMGISTVRSYVGSGLFEVIGLSEEMIAAHFPGTPSLVGGLGLDDVANESLARHDAGFAGAPGGLEAGGFHRFRRLGDAHAYAPNVVKALRAAAQSDDRLDYASYTRLVHARDPIALRDLLALRERRSLPIADVESVESLGSRFTSAAMSLGALSPEAHEVLAAAMRRMGARSNSGEGGEDGARNAVKQVASARFGVTTDYLVSAEELQIKMAQGSKPGEGGQLPGHKTVAHIARVRRAPEGTTLISPPPHHDIYSIEDLAQLIFDLKRVHPTAPVGVKLVSQAGIGTVAAGVAKAGADAILIGGHDGGTGASPLSSIKHAGTPWELGLAEVQQALVSNGLRDRVRLQVEGGLKTGRDVVIAALLGADEFGFGTAALVAAGCVMARQCHLDTCPAGIATQREDLRDRFTGEPEDVVRFFRAVADEVREILARLGARRLDEIVGRVELLEMRTDLLGKARLVDLGRVLAPPGAGPRRFEARHPSHAAPHSDDQVLERLPFGPSGPAPVSMTLPVRNTDRAVGARVAGAIARGYPEAVFPPALVRLSYRGSAGQSFGAFAVSGMRLELEGEANDGLGKGLSGGEIVVRPPEIWRAREESPVLAGNAALYGATSGTLFLAGRAGERFAVRNSGALAVVEGVGEHGCEYMTAGTVVVLGSVGRNFAAGMSGGEAFVLDREQGLERRLNGEMVWAAEPTEAESEWLLEIAKRHHQATGSALAARILNDWVASRAHFRRVAPKVSVESAARDRGRPVAATIDIEGGTRVSGPAWVSAR